MGCGSSTDSQPEERTFAVTILNEKEEVQGKGELTVTSEAMTLLSQGESERAVWELRYLRRFGFDKKYFSFEAGRRCTDGPGIWAVSTPKAEQLFQMVDYYINKVKAKPEAASTGTAAQGAGYSGVNKKKKLAYAQLDLSNKAAFKIPSKPKEKGKATSYAELDFDQMDAIANQDGSVAL
eukprot:TRINITY_DN5364_c0_g1_i2.p1 TRINITY_DN5364_c0_g1~~TRINITY_DN5364_c0_g1_i2.p1  ORF type:complete len:180 (+),score=47.38 TRINITY_DN5364_c0_g1_i2:160-699(+)